MAQNGTTGAIRKLGLLAGAFQDGSISIYVVPCPSSLAVSKRPIFG
jgi:hypothetical protein